MKKYTHVTIDRKRWFRGDDSGKSMLRLGNGKQCCLGFAARTLGAKAKDILNQGMPECLNVELPGLNKKEAFGGIRDTSFSLRAATINDDEAITDRQREAQLKKLARQNGFIFEFVG